VIGNSAYAAPKALRSSIGMGFVRIEAGTFPMGSNDGDNDEQRRRERGSMQEKLNRLLQAVQGYHPQRLILFESVARSEADADSDLDVLVIKDTTDSCVCCLEAMAELCPLGAHADILVYTPDELQQMVDEENLFIFKALC
jgi:predicted nucleotidyltransferase